MLKTDKVKIELNKNNVQFFNKDTFYHFYELTRLINKKDYHIEERKI